MKQAHTAVVPELLLRDLGIKTININYNFVNVLVIKFIEIKLHKNINI